MIYNTLIYNNVRVCYSECRIEGGISEHSAILVCCDKDDDCAAQLAAIDEALESLKSELRDCCEVLRRYYLSDPVNQAHLIGEHDCAVSVVGQMAQPGYKVALQVYMLQDAVCERIGPRAYAVCHGAYEHILTVGASADHGDAYDQTRRAFDDLALTLGAANTDIARGCQRTWLYVRDIDINYADVVRARNDVFDSIGLTRDTHFIASTGIGAVMPDATARMLMDAYSVVNLDQAQVTYLKARDNMNPTAEYGVAFERGTMIDYGDRRQVFVSGTASIDNRGQILYPGDVKAQCRRALDNVKALLREASCDTDDIASMVVYLRDTADYDVIHRLLDSLLPYVPTLIVAGAVCRPGWLIEIECMAVKNSGNPRWAPL